MKFHILAIKKMSSRTHPYWSYSAITLQHWEFPADFQVCSKGHSPSETSRQQHLMFYWKDRYNYKKMEKKKKKSNVHISGFSSVIFSQHTYNRSCSPDTDTEDNQEPCDAMFLRSIYHSYPIDPAANMPEPRLPGHNGPVHRKASRDSTSSGMPYRSGQI